ncbi:thioredoxin family protein [Brasilonema octagenarum UFV-E1]|uniref:Thioredoxin family protein n=1 Tax=Brasilonema sennae CENA114 TaxID=415709 RepID=A0A856MLX3_9CYAN|nr:thioredoxin family protein [Brasilonema sennae]QDL11100.1 thioredoxin family protein [Brasilonema sennae CENA114]QDL17445.1 thioredoxin family protein [Brasilonema octagenarum UFV-E1]
MKNQLIAIALYSAFSLALTACQNPSTVSQNTPNVASNAAEAATPVRVGSPAPDFTATDSNGKSHRLSDFKGKVVVLEWTNHQCPFVLKHYNSNNMQKLQKETTGKGVVWLSVISSAQGQQGYVTPQEANQLTKSRNASPTAVLLDASGEIGRLYQARTTPHIFVIDSSGVLKYAGAIDDKPSTNAADIKSAKNYVIPAVDSVLKGQNVADSTTQPYGCSVKYGS